MGFICVFYMLYLYARRNKEEEEKKRRGKERGGRRTRLARNQDKGAGGGLVVVVGWSLGQRNGGVPTWVDLAGIDPRDQTQGI